jgi:hypothetical protein
MLIKAYGFSLTTHDLIQYTLEIPFLSPVLIVLQRFLLIIQQTMENC